jgi:hypothetical protein
MSREDVFLHLKAIYKISFKGKYKDIYPPLPKTQRLILNAITGLNSK